MDCRKWTLFQNILKVRFLAFVISFILYLTEWRSSAHLSTSKTVFHLYFLYFLSFFGLHSTYCLSFWWNSLNHFPNTNKYKQITVLWIRQDIISYEYMNIINLLLNYTYRTSCHWLKHGCLISPQQLCVGNCLQLDDVYCPSNQFQTVKVMLFMCLWADNCLVSMVMLFAFDCCLYISADIKEGSWEARWQNSKPRCPLKTLSSDDVLSESPVVNRLSRHQVWNWVLGFTYKYFKERDKSYFYPKISKGSEQLCLTLLCLSMLVLTVDCECLWPSVSFGSVHWKQNLPSCLSFLPTAYIYLHVSDGNE